MYTYWAPVAAARCGFKMVLFTASHRNTFVRGNIHSIECPSSCVFVDTRFRMRNFVLNIFVVSEILKSIITKIGKGW